MNNLDIRNTTKVTPTIAFEKIKKDVLGGQYELSLVLIGDILARRLNKEHKNKDIPTNVLSFPISLNEGELFINVRRAQRDAPSFAHTHSQHILFLFIHGCLHLKGLLHGSEMESEEDRYFRKYT